MIAQGMTIRAGPRWRDRLIPLPRGDTGEPSEGRKGNQETLRKATGMGPPGWSVSVLGCGMGRGGPPMRPPILRKAPGIGPPVKVTFIEGVSWKKVTVDRGRLQREERVESL
jgi:hypothetical protein